MNYELLQPWSTFVMKTQLPSEVLQKMLKITDEIVEKNPAENMGSGEMKEQFPIDLKILEKEEVMVYFLQVCKQYVILAFSQAQPENKENILKEEWLTRMTLMWVNSQRDNDFFPLHAHSNCQLSSVLYLKIPEYLPTHNPYTNAGAIEFTGNASRNQTFLGRGTLEVRPQVGDIFIFTADQQHCVYPFRTQGEKGERRSISFNAQFTTMKKDKI